jgi:radical SAM superfamily enzyme YgiQ (UPF0313 family)
MRSVDATPFLALKYANALAVGEAYQFVREILSLIKKGGTIEDVRDWILQYPHAIEQAQIRGLRRDKIKPWLLTTKPTTLASPNTRIDWIGPPPILSDDNTIRLIASKGCLGKCLFCATTWRQQYQCHDVPSQILARGKRLAKQDQRVMLITNDLAALPWFDDIDFPIDSSSLSVKYLLGDQSIKPTLARIRAKRLRFGIEGVSDRLRAAVGKAIDGDGLIDLMDYLMNDCRQGTHLFYIVGLPFETKEDWEEFRDFYYRLVRRVDAMLCRIKFTAFEVAPPSPLARFVISPCYYERFAETYDWICRNAARRHFTHIKPYKTKSLSRELAATLGIERGLALRLIEQGNFDLAPTIEEAERMPWEIIEWPIATARRWKMAERYRKRLQCN